MALLMNHELETERQIKMLRAIMEQGFNNEDNFINSQQRAYIEHLA